MVYGRTTGKIFPVGWKIFSCWKEIFFLLEGKTFPEVRPKKFSIFENLNGLRTNNRKIFSSCQEIFFQLSGNFFPVGRKFFSCWKEGLGMPEGFDKTIYLIELPEPSLVSSVKIKSAFTLLV